MVSVTRSAKAFLMLVFVSLGCIASATAQSSFPVKILLPEKMPVHIESAHLLKFEDKYTLTYRLINKSRQPLTGISMTVSISKPDGKMQMQHMWLRNDLQIVSDQEDTITLPGVIQEGAQIALSVHYTASGTDSWNVDLTALNDALRKYQETGSAILPKAVYIKIK